MEWLSFANIHREAPEPTLLTTKLDFLIVEFVHTQLHPIES